MLFMQLFMFVFFILRLISKFTSCAPKFDIAQILVSENMFSEILRISGPCNPTGGTCSFHIASVFVSQLVF